MRRFKIRLPKTLERDIERPVCRYAKRLKLLYPKLSVRGQNSWPDRFFIGPKSRYILMEFKRPGKEATEKQSENHTALRKLGHPVVVCDDVSEGIAVLNAMVRFSDARWQQLVARCIG